LGLQVADHISLTMSIREQSLGPARTGLRTPYRSILGKHESGSGDRGDRCKNFHAFAACLFLRKVAVA
jgi:hypothetical protein